MRFTKSDKFVCAKCFDDEGIQQFINNSATSRQCSYCGRKKTAADWSEVCEFIETCLEREYDTPENCLGRDNESESGWALIDPTDTWDLFFDLGFGSNSKELFDDLVSEFMDRQWVQRDPYGYLPCDGWESSWESFSRQVKHQMRFVFFKVKTQHEYDPEPEPHTILNALGRIIDQLGLVRIFQEGHIFVRARQHESAEVISCVSRIGPPPSELASQSRMSPAGIAMFYGADCLRTAFEEVAENVLTKNRATFGMFKALRPLRLLDLTALPFAPSIFCDDDTYSSRMPLIFIRRFVENAMKPITRDGREHIDYVPTQVVSEYFRYLFRAKDGEQLDGIAYPSSKVKGGVCFTLFFDIGNCTDEKGWRCSAWRTDKPTLKLESLETRTVTFSPPDYH